MGGNQKSKVSSDFFLAFELPPSFQTLFTFCAPKPNFLGPGEAFFSVRSHPILSFYLSQRCLTSDRLDGSDHYLWGRFSKTFTAEEERRARIRPQIILHYGTRSSRKNRNKMCDLWGLNGWDDTRIGDSWIDQRPPKLMDARLRIRSSLFKLQIRISFNCPSLLILLSAWSPLTHEVRNDVLARFSSLLRHFPPQFCV